MGDFPKIREQIPDDRFLRRQYAATGSMQYVRSIRMFTMGKVRVMMSRDPIGSGLRWHISLSCNDRAPTWEEIKHIQNELKPGVFFCIPMPPQEFWMSIHPFTYHLEEVLDEEQIRHWKAQAE